MSKYTDLKAEVAELKSLLSKLESKALLSELRFTTEGVDTPPSYYRRFLYFSVRDESFEGFTGRKLISWYRMVITEYCRVTGYSTKDLIGRYEPPKRDIATVEVALNTGVYTLQEALDDIVGMALAALRAEELATRIGQSISE